jgi:hypothetical protein
LTLHFPAPEAVIEAEAYPTLERLPTPAYSYVRMRSLLYRLDRPERLARTALPVRQDRLALPVRLARLVASGRLDRLAQLS